MKTLVQDKVSLYLFSDDTAVNMQADCIIVGNPQQFIIADCNESNTTLFEGVTAPDDWVGGKYLYEAGEWTLNQLWVNPELTPALL